MLNTPPTLELSEVHPVTAAMARTMLIGFSQLNNFIPPLFL